MSIIFRDPYNGYNDTILQEMTVEIFITSTEPIPNKS